MDNEMCCLRLTRFSSKSTLGNFSFNAAKTFAVSAAILRLQCASHACVFQVEYEAQGQTFLKVIVSRLEGLRMAPRAARSVHPTHDGDSGFSKRNSHQHMV